MRDPIAAGRAKDLRRDMTEMEVRLWTYLRRRQLGVRFRRQEPIGPNIADFVCRARRLVVELDGWSHDDLQRDLDRDAATESRGFRVLRFTNDDVYEDVGSVVDAIASALRTREEPGQGLSPR